MSNYVTGPDDEIHDKEWNPRQEAKPLTQDEIKDVMANALNGQSVELRTAKLIFDLCPPAIHAALPPDQSVRIAELVAIVERATIEMEASGGWDGDESLFDDMMALLARIKSSS